MTKGLLKWAGTTVRHLDGRTGVVEEEAGLFPCRLLIRCLDGSAEEFSFQPLNPESWSAKWEWFCPAVSNWLPLGDTGRPVDPEVGRCRSRRALYIYCAQKLIKQDHDIDVSYEEVAALYDRMFRNE